MQLQYRLIFQARYVFTIMATLGMAMAFAMRNCLSLVITKLVPDPDAVPGNSSHQEMRFAWDEETQGIILGAFYAGYLVTQIPGGYLSERFGGKYTFGLGILSTAILTLLSPFVIQNNPWPFIVLRFAEGVGEGTVLPSLYTLLAQWAPPSEKSVITSTTLLGGLIGTLAANLISGIILEYVPNAGWQLVFYVFGIISIIWYGWWQVLCYSDPQSHPFISDEEKLYLEKEMGRIERNKNLKPTPWKQILTSKAIWALIIASIGQDWGIYTIIIDFPKYMNDVLKYSPVENGALSGISYTSIFVATWISSSLCDWLLHRKIFSAAVVRKSYATLSTVGLSLGIVIASYLHSNFVVGLCIVLGTSCIAFGFSSIKVTALDLSPNYSGSVMALVNAIGCISGILTPYVVGVLTTNRSAEEWRIVFWLMALVSVLTNMVFIIFGSCSLQNWNHLDDDT